MKANFRLRLFFLPVVLACMVLGTASTAWSFTVGIVADTKTAEMQQFVATIFSELDTILGSREGGVNVDTRFIRYTGWDVAAVETALSDLEKAPEVEAIVAIGGLAANLAGKRGEWKKPTIAIGISDAAVQKIPITRNGTSGKARFTYLLAPFTFIEELHTLLRVAPMKRIGVMAETLLWEHSEARKYMDSEGRKHGIELVPVPILSSEAPLPDLGGFDGLMVSRLYQFPAAFRERVYDEALRLKIPTFAGAGERDVRRGALVGSTPRDEVRHLARFAALRLETASEGGSLADLKVRDGWDQKVYINLDTARAIGISPPWEMVIEGEIIERKRASGRKITIDEVVRLATGRHVSVLQGKETLAREASGLDATRARRLPSVTAGMSGTQVDPDIAVNGTAERTTKVEGTVRQVIFSDSVNTAIDVQTEVFRQAEASLDERALDAILAVGGHYLEVLRQEALFRTRKETLSRTRTNLEIATERESVGYSGRADVLRWESELASARQLLVQTRSDLRSAENTLKRSLGWPLDMEIRLADTTLSTSMLDRLGDALEGDIQNPAAFISLARFLEEEALTLRPEVRRQQSVLAAAIANRKMRKRARWVPDVSVQGTGTHILDRDGDGANLPVPEDTWNVGVSASWTLYSGGEIHANAETALRDQRLGEIALLETKRVVREEVRNRMNALLSAHFNMTFSETAAKAAAATLELVQDSYSRGAQSVTDLLDAREADIRARESVEQAVYNYLEAILGMDRAMGEYDFMRTDVKRADLVRRFRIFNREEGRFEPRKASNF